MKKKKIRYYIVLERAQGPTLLDSNYADTCFTAARGSVLAGGCTQVPHRTPLYRQAMSFASREDLESICPLSFCSLLLPKMAGKSTEISRTQILRDAPSFIGEHVNWVDYKEKLDNVLFFYSRFLRDIFQRQARPEKYVPVPNDVTIPTYVEFRRPSYEAQPIPEQWRGNAEREAQCSASPDVARAAAELTGPVTPAAPIAGSVTGHTDLTLPNTLGFQGTISSYSGKYRRNKFPEEPCMRTVGSRKRRTVSHHISYV